VGIILAILLLFPITAEAAWHLYLVPLVADSDSSRAPKYVTALGVKWSMIDYGFQPVGLVAADVDGATDTSLQGNGDVTKIPDNLDNLLGAGAVSAVQTALENKNIPAGWVTQSLSYRTVLRTIWGFFAFLQRYAVVSGNTNPIIAASVNLDTQFGSLPQTAQDNLAATAKSLGLNTTGVTGTTTLRVILKGIADQWGQRAFTIGGVTI
jgi:hypothetical protein